MAAQADVRGDRQDVVARVLRQLVLLAKGRLPGSIETLVEIVGYLRRRKGEY
jgi:hypothetical protein